MKTIQKKSNNIKWLTMLTLLLMCFSVSAENSVSTFINNLFPSGLTGLYIIAGPILFGILVYIIMKIVGKYKKDEPHENPFKRYSSHKHHRHHRAIKKSV